MDVLVLVAAATIAAELLGVSCAWVGTRRSELAAELPYGRRRLHALAKFVRPVTELTFLLGLLYVCGAALGATL